MKLAKLLCGVALGGLLASNAMAADLLYSAPAPQAAWSGGPYFGAKIGAVWADDVGVNSDAAADGLDVYDFDTGFTGSIIAGYAFGTRWGALSPRLEVEAGYLQADVDTWDVDGATTAAPAVGELNSFYWFTNLLLDIPMSGWGFTPFIGGGVGFAQVNFDNFDITSPASSPFDINDSDTAFAWNLTAGLSYDISRNVTLDFAYRFIQLNSVDVLAGGASLFPSSEDINISQVTAGVRVHL